MGMGECISVFLATREALIEAMGKALDEVTASDARGFFAHRGYNSLVQSLRETL